MQGKKEEDLQRELNKVSEVGIDEVGRGAIFGPVFSAVVVLSEENKSTSIWYKSCHRTFNDKSFKKIKENSI